MQHCAKKVTLFYDDFSSGVLPGSANSPYYFFQGDTPEGPYIGKDAAGGVTATKNSLQVNSTPYTITTASDLNNVKYLVYNKKVFEAPGYLKINCKYVSQEIVYDAVMSAQQKFPSPPFTIPYPYPEGDTDLKGVNNARSDLRICSSALNTVDFETFMVFDFFLTDEDIYAFYERLPFGKTPENNYHAFSHAIPVGKRAAVNSLGDFVKLSIAYNREEGYTRWLVNDLEVFRVERIGYPLERKYRILDHGGVAGLVRPRSLSTGFGNFTLLNMQNPQNPGQIPNAGLLDLRTPQVRAYAPIRTDQLGLPVEPVYIQTPYKKEFALFDQGSTLNLKYVHVYKQLQGGLTYPESYKEEIRFTRAQLNAIPGVNALAPVITTYQ